MRCYQEIGLRPEAETWLEQNCQKSPTNICKHCGKPNGEILTVISRVDMDSFYGDGPTLHTYLQKNGQWVREIIQAEPWSSGPCSFFCLELENGVRLFEWDQKDIDKA
jgi:hypothetical protein